MSYFQVQPGPRCLLCKISLVGLKGEHPPSGTLTSSKTKFIFTLMGICNTGNIMSSLHAAVNFFFPMYSKFSSVKAKVNFRSGLWEAFGRMDAFQSLKVYTLEQGSLSWSSALDGNPPCDKISGFSWGSLGKTFVYTILGYLYCKLSFKILIPSINTYMASCLDMYLTDHSCTYSGSKVFMPSGPSSFCSAMSSAFQAFSGENISGAF